MITVVIRPLHVLTPKQGAGPLNECNGDVTSIMLLVEPQVVVAHELPCDLIERGLKSLCLFLKERNRSMVLPPVERLDLVARSRASTGTISRARIALSILTPLFVLLAVNSEAPSRDTALVYVIAGGSFLTAIILWLDWRFKVHALSVFCFLFAIVDVVSKDHPRSHTVLGWVAAHALVPLFVYYGSGLWMMGRRYAKATGNSFREEREQLDKWMAALSGATAIEFPSGSFWTGYWTYSVLNPGSCWLVAQFKRGSTKLSSCRVYELSDVSFRHLPSGKWQIEMGGKGEKKKLFLEVEVSSGSPPVLSMT
jgi:hypothetical protein